MKQIPLLAILLLSWTQTSQASTPVTLDGPEAVQALQSITQSVAGGAARSTHAILVWTHPPVDGRRYALRGRVRYEGVEGEGFLEMWNHFGAKGSYFSRTLGSGPLAALRGDSAEREFFLPFDMGDAATQPERIEFNIVLPGPGTVSVRDLRWTAGDDAWVAPSRGNGGSAWWSQRGTGVFGAVAGTLLGIVGALVGTFSSLGRARHFVMTLLGAEALGALVALGAGMTAAIGGQALHVVLSLFGVGLLAGLGAGFGRRIALLRYRDVEFRKMRALDLDVATASPRH